MVPCWIHHLCISLMARCGGAIYQESVDSMIIVTIVFKGDRISRNNGSDDFKSFKHWFLPKEFVAHCRGVVVDSGYI